MNKIIGLITFLIIAFIILIPTLEKVTYDYNQRHYLINEKKIIEAAEDCYYSQKCSDKKITIRLLKSKGYLQDSLIDPVTKAEYNVDSYVIISEKTTFYLK